VLAILVDTARTSAPPAVASTVPDLRMSASCLVSPGPNSAARMTRKSKPSLFFE